MGEIDHISVEAQLQAFFKMNLSHTDPFTDPELPPAFSSQKEREEAFSGLQKRINSIEELLDSVARVMLTYQEEVARLKTEQNKLVPIGRLPDETLEEIFMGLTHGSLSEENKLNTMSPHLSLFATARVCSRWRSIALGCPQLWTKPYFGPKLHYAKSMVERARDHPLNIVWNADSDPSQSFEYWNRFSKTMRDNLVLELIPRALTLSIELLICGGQYRKAIPEAPLLRKIQVCFEYSYGHPDYASDLLQRLLGQRNRALESADLKNATLFGLSDPTSLSIMASLKFLKMGFYAYQYWYPVNIETAVICLRQLPNLRYLGLHDVIREAHNSDDTYSATTLYALRELHLAEHPLTCVRFLERVECPRLTRLNIELTQIMGDEVTPSLIRDVFASIPSHILELEAGAGYSFELSPTSIRSWEITVSIKPLNHKHRPSHLTLSFSVELARPFFYDSISTACSILGSRNLVITSPQSSNLRSEGSLWNDLGSLPEIQTLLITDAHPSFFNLRLLGNGLSNKESSSCFPSLRQLSFSNCDFSMPDDPQASSLRDMQDAHATSLLSELLAYIQARSALGLDLQCLEFVRCRGLTVDELRRFEGVCEVSWDGVEV